MDSTLEAGYLAKLFTESVYLMGYETTKEEITQTRDEVTVNTVIPKETIVPKLEIKKMPVAPTSKVEMQKIETQKISKKCILLFVSEEDELKTRELEFLTAMMNACKVLPGEFECINFKDITINDIAARYSYNKLILMGVTIPGLVIGQYKNTQIKTTQIISADDVWMLESNKNLKKQLWDQLQLMFGLVK